jgi:TonB family protein
MKPQTALLLFSFSLASACQCQSPKEQNVPPECTKMTRVRGSFPKGSFNILPQETYKGSPLIKYQIQEDGTIFNAKITRSSGVADIDKKVLAAVARWKYKPRPIGCGVIETEMSVNIDWASFP